MSKLKQVGQDVQGKEHMKTDRDVRSVLLPTQEQLVQADKQAHRNVVFRCTILQA